MTWYICGSQRQSDCSVEAAGLVCSFGTDSWLVAAAGGEAVDGRHGRDEAKGYIPCTVPSFLFLILGDLHLYFYVSITRSRKSLENKEHTSLMLSLRSEQDS